MSLFTRLRDVTRASLNELLDHLEDPVMMINQYVRDMEAEITRVETSIARHIAQERFMTKGMEEAETYATEREQAAAKAVEEGHEETAKLALAEKLLAVQKIAELRQAISASETFRTELTARMNELKAELVIMQSKQKEMIQRAEAAKAKKHMADAAGYGYGAVETGGAAKGFNRMEEKILRMEAEAELRRVPGQGGIHSMTPHSGEAVLVEELERLKAKLAESKQQV